MEVSEVPGIMQSTAFNIPASLFPVSQAAASGTVALQRIFQHSLRTKSHDLYSEVWAEDPMMRSLEV